MAKEAKDSEVIVIEKLDPKMIMVTITGDSDLICNKMNAVITKQLIDARKDKAKKVAEKSNMWEEVITAIHWRDGNPSEFSEASLMEALESNAPCISAFGLAQSFKDAVVRFGIDKYSTKFRAAVNISSDGGLIPFTFSEYHLDEKLMSPKMGAPVLSRQSRFSGWEAKICIRFIDSLYSMEQIVNIINLAGFGLGIGSGRSSGFGRYHVTNVELI